MNSFKNYFNHTLQSGKDEKVKVSQPCRLSQRNTFVVLTFSIFVFFLGFNFMLPNTSYKEIFGPDKIFMLQRVDPSEFEVVSSNDDLACRIPRLDPYDSTIKHLLKPPANEDCTKEYSYLFNSTADFKLLPQNTFRGNKALGIVSCCYRKIERDKGKDPDNSCKFVGECRNLSLEEPTKLNMKTEEFVAIFCLKRKNNGTTEKDIEDEIVDTHAFVPLKPQVEERIKKYYSKSAGKGSFMKEEEKLNVVILGIDGTSHMNFLRTMPNAYHFLMKNLSAVEFHGVNKIGDNTYPNIAAALTFRNTSELNNTCEVKKAFDNCPFIWKEFAAQGYRTSYGEDSPWMGIFNYMKKGFLRPPTDYYLRPFSYATEKLIAHDKKMNAKICYGPRLTFQVLLDYMQKFAYTMGKDKRYFQFIWATSLTHDYLMEGKLGELHLLSTLQWFQKGGYLNNTAFILMSDHGIRWGDIRTFHQGQLEERLPFLYFILPQWFKEKYKRAFSNLKQNQDILTTPFDFHETLEDLLKLQQLNDVKLKEREISLNNMTKLPRGISQFLPLPTGRTCRQASIPEHYCSCHSLTSISNDVPVIQQAANYLVFNINRMISKYAQCAYLTLKEILSAGSMDSNVKDKRDFTAYSITVKTNPGDAVFESTLARNKKGDWRVAGSIQRINLYGNQSHCINEKDMKLYCYCVDYLKLDIDKGR